MSHDQSLPRFLAYLSLFTFFMLFLLSSGNFIQFFFAWEGVGLCSYLLINFWYTGANSWSTVGKFQLDSDRTQRRMTDATLE